jgi:hypothetical protein
MPHPSSLLPPLTSTTTRKQLSIIPAFARTFTHPFKSYAREWQYVSRSVGPQFLKLASCFVGRAYLKSAPSETTFSPQPSSPAMSSVQGHGNIEDYADARPYLSAARVPEQVLPLLKESNTDDDYHSCRQGLNEFSVYAQGYLPLKSRCPLDRA